MKIEKIPYLKWKERIEEITPIHKRIGTDLLLIDKPETRIDSLEDNEPFKVDVTMAIIYEQGSAELKINMRAYSLKAPCVLIVMAGQIYQPVSNSEDLKSKAIVISRSFSDALFPSFGETQQLYMSVLKQPVIVTENDQMVFTRYYELMSNLVQSPESDFKLEAARHLTLAMFYGYTHIKHTLSEDDTRKNRKNELHNDFLKLLHKHYKKEREMAFYADKLCVTPKYLSQVIKDVTGHSALKYIEDYVISESKALLSSTNMTIQQISEDLNFPSQSVFGKYFKRIAGVSPKEYRNRY